MQVAKTENFTSRYKKLPKSIQKKADKQILNLEKNFFYPSLRTKKLQGFEDWWEFRVDYHYRMIGKKSDEVIIIHSVGPHDEVLKP